MKTTIKQSANDIKKPIKASSIYSFYECPKCNYLLDFYDCDDSCPSCGQELDWSFQEKVRKRLKKIGWF